MEEKVVFAGCFIFFLLFLLMLFLVFRETKVLGADFNGIPYERLEENFGKYFGFIFYVAQRWLLKKTGKWLVFGIVALAGFNTLTGVFGDSILVWLAKRIFGPQGI